MVQSELEPSRLAPPVAVIVLNWNGRENTLVCLDALTLVKYENLAIIVVDNGSTDNSVPAFRAAYPRIEVIETGSNLGYAGGNNVGIAHAIRRGAEYVLILNNDTTVDPEAVGHAISVAQTYGDSVGVIGFATYQQNAPEVLHNLGINAGTQGGFYVPSPRMLHESDALPIGSAHGCAMLLTRKLVETIGLFDEDFFLVHEEVDLCARARQAGFAVLGATRARVWHIGGVSFGGEDSPLRVFYHWRNWPLYVHKRLTETNEANQWASYLKDYEVAVHDGAIQCLREHKPAHAFSLLAALRCASVRRWGKKDLSLGLRLLICGDLFKLYCTAALRSVRRRLRPSRVK